MATATTAAGSRRPSSANVSYETFAPRSSSQVSRLSRIAALTAGPAALAASSTDTYDDSGAETLLRAMSPPEAYSTINVSKTDAEEKEEDEVQTALSEATSKSDHLTNLLKHTTSLRLALRASINIAEDISNRHAELIRHSGELSAAADRLQGEQEMMFRHAEEIGMHI